MNEIKLSDWDTTEPRINLFKQRKKVLWLIVSLCCLTMIPINIKNFLLGNYLLGWSLSCFIVVLLIDTASIHIRATAPIHYSIPTSLLVFSLLLAIIETQTLALFWLFPVSVSFIFILPEKPAHIFNTILVTGAAVITYNQFGLDITSRYILALIFTLVIVTVVLNIINALSQKLKEESTRDPLTGALNRRQLQFYLDDCLAQNKRFDTSAAIILFDIDNFKAINDELGHSSGDKAIIQVSDKIFQNTRETDLFFRIGGDEFMLLVRNTSLKKADQLANKICQLVNNDLTVGHLELSVSIGVSNIVKEYSHSIWMDCADKALYQAKEAGRNCVAVYVSA